MPVDDGDANATPAKLVSQHQSSRAGSNDKNIGHHLNLLRRTLHRPKRKVRAILARWYHLAEIWPHSGDLKPLPPLGPSYRRALQARDVPIGTYCAGQIVPYCCDLVR